MGELRTNLGRRIRALREAHGWTQEELGKASGLGAKYVGLVERGEKASFEAAEKFAKALNVEGYELFIPLHRHAGSVERQINELLEDERQIEPAKLQEFLRGLRALIRKLDRRAP